MDHETNPANPDKKSLVLCFDGTGTTLLLLTGPFIFAARYPVACSEATNQAQGTDSKQMTRKATF